MNKSIGQWIAIWSAVALALVLVAGMLFGYQYSLQRLFGIDRYVRDVCIALWAFLLPAWFTLEEAWFAPKDPDALARFREQQQKARMLWVVVGGAVAVIIGSTADAPP